MRQHIRPTPADRKRREERDRQKLADQEAQVEERRRQFAALPPEERAARLQKDLEDLGWA